MLRTTPARLDAGAQKFTALEAQTADCAVLSEADLASRWAMSPKTLQRWRMEGRGPHYLKLGKRVSYPLNAVLAYENCVQHVSTSQRTAA